MFQVVLLAEFDPMSSFTAVGSGALIVILIAVVVALLYFWVRLHDRVRELEQRVKELESKHEPVIAIRES